MIGEVDHATPHLRLTQTANKLLHRNAQNKRLPVPPLLEGKLLSEWPGQWCYCKSANPRRSATILQKFGIGVAWIPYETVRRMYNGKAQNTDRVMMPGYLFVNLNDTDVLFDAKRAAKIASITHPRGVSQARFRTDLDRLQVCSLDPTPKHICAGLVRGRRVEIVRGPFQGGSGVIISDNGVDKFVIELPLLGHRIEYECFAHYLEAVA